MLWKLKIILKLHGYLRNVKYFVEMLVKFTASISSHLSTFSECMQWDTPSNSKFFLVFFFSAMETIFCCRLMWTHVCIHTLFCRGITVPSMESGRCKMLGQFFPDVTCTKIKLLRYSLQTDVSFLSGDSAYRWVMRLDIMGFLVL